jgi:hypothetical protein
MDDAASAAFSDVGRSPWQGAAASAAFFDVGVSP